MKYVVVPTVATVSIIMTFCFGCTRAYLPDAAVDLTNSLSNVAYPAPVPSLPDEVSENEQDAEFPDEESELDSLYRNKLTFRRRNVNTGQSGRMTHKQGYGSNGRYPLRPGYFNAERKPFIGHNSQSAILPMTTGGSYGPYPSEEDLYGGYLKSGYPSSSSPSGLLNNNNNNNKKAAALSGYYGSIAAMRNMKPYKTKVPFDYPPEYTRNDLVFASAASLGGSQTIPSFRELAATYGNRYGRGYTTRERFAGEAPPYGMGGFPSAYPQPTRLLPQDFGFGSSNQWNGGKAVKMGKDAAIGDSYNDDEEYKNKQKAVAKKQRR
ncbi:unnamed protein product [Caenorhabditis auriculariae]|uniref:Uncharacterized protein n=1 Tax=Caenorhabditis auriculariae TaxID=2777116 RepID=A0A8S1HDE6_9PELO|nr:unnamed protein product [Caenorhabditis auriculariae]